MKLGKKLGHITIERNITPTDLFTADEAFFTDAAAEIVPTAEVNKRVIGEGKLGPVTRRIMKEFEKLIKDAKEGTPIYQ